MSVAWPTGVHLVFCLLFRIFSKLFGAQGAPSLGSLLLTESMSPRFLFIMVVFVIYLFVLGDSLTSQRFTTRTEELTKCCEPLQKLRVRLGACEIDLNPPVFL